MNHEPECSVAIHANFLPELSACSCNKLRAAYKRGIDDAEKAIHRQVQSMVKELLEIQPFTTAYEYQKQQAVGMVKAFETVRQIKSDKVTITSHSRPLKGEPKNENPTKDIDDKEA